MSKDPKPLVSPFPPDKTFDPVNTYDWPATTQPPYELSLGTDGAVVVTFTVPAKIGSKLRVNVSYIGTTEYPAYVLNWSAKALDFNGAKQAYQVVAADFMVVAADDPNANSHEPISQPGPTRGYIPLIAGAQMCFNIATLNAKVASQTRIQPGVS